jgi:superfamily I DNA and/or RNA helicase
MLAEGGLSPEDRKILRQELEEVKSGEMKKRQNLLGKVRVVGVTCAACVFSVLEKNQFQIVILDECSQMIEPVVSIPLPY